jgi:hypothetical protein
VAPLTHPSTAPQAVGLGPGLSLTLSYAGHVLGAAMALLTAGQLSVLYTGMNSRIAVRTVVQRTAAVRHTAAAWRVRGLGAGTAGLEWACCKAIVCYRVAGPGDFNSSAERHLGAAELGFPAAGPAGAAFRRPVR